MPFTEKDLRAMLEDNSSDLPPTGDLAASAQERGRRVRRRQAAGAVAAAALVASASPSSRPWAPPTDPKSSWRPSVPHPPTTRPDVDLSMLKKLKKGEFTFAFTTSLDVRTASPEESREPSLLLGTLKEQGDSYAVTTKPLGNSIIGTVEGFSLDPNSFPKRFGGQGKKQQQGIRMKIRLGAQLDDSAEFQRRGLREGETVDVHVGYAAPRLGPDGRSHPSSSSRHPGSGLRGDPLRLSEISQLKETRDVHSAILEDADGTLTGGPYRTADPDPRRPTTPGRR